MSGDFSEPDPDDSGVTPPPPPPPPPPPAGAGAGVGPDEQLYQYGGTAPAPPPPTGVLPTARATRILLWVLAGLLVLSALQDFNYAQAVNDLADGRTTLSSVEDIENRVNGMAALYLLLMLVTAVVWLVWQSKIRLAGEAFGARDFRRKRAWAIGAWFVPFANLVVPKRELDDLWRAGDPESGRTFSITGMPVPGLLTAWWACFIGSNIISPRFFGDEQTLGQIAGNARRSAVSELVMAVAAVLAVQVVTKLTDRYRERAQSVGAQLS